MGWWLRACVHVYVAPTLRGVFALLFFFPVVHRSVFVGVCVFA